MERDLASSTNVNISQDVMIDHPSKSLNETILYAFYGMSLDNILVKSVNVSLGGPKDGFYKKTNFVAWYVMTYDHKCLITTHYFP